MKTLSKSYCGETIEIDVDEQEYAEALEQARIDLGIETQEEAEEREDEIEEYLVEYFEEYFQEEIDRIEQEAQEESEFYDELKSWYNKRTGV